MRCPNCSCKVIGRGSRVRVGTTVVCPRCGTASTVEYDDGDDVVVGDIEADDDDEDDDE